jgi:hypothetical protein
MVFENCLRHPKTFPLILTHDDVALLDISIEIKRSTILSDYALFRLGLKCPLPSLPDSPQAPAPFRFDVSESILKAPAVLAFEQRSEFLEKTPMLSPDDAKGALLRLLKWQGERNLYVTRSPSVRWIADRKQQPPRGPNNLEEWKQFWGTAEIDSLEGGLRFQGGDLSSRLALNELTPDDFRLRPDSPGYRALPGGKDLGADVDLVGPGAAYERWKKTPEYQKWLTDTGQMK